MNPTEVKAKFLKDLKEKGRIHTIGNVFGEIHGNDGYVEEIVKPEEGGTFVRIYGCNYLYKGFPSHVQVHGLELAKSLISEIPRELIARSYLFSAAVILMFLFARKRLIHYADHMFDVILRRSIRWYDIPPKEYNAFGRELKRATTEALKEVFELTDAEIERAQDVNRKIGDYIQARHVRHHPKQLGYLLARISKMVILFLELDCSYRWRVQDAFVEGDFFECLDRMASRETAQGIAHKWRFLRRALKVAFFFMPELEQFVNATMKHLDRSKVEMDEADWYFSLKWESYDFGGMPKEERFELRDSVDKEMGHVFLA